MLSISILCGGKSKRFGSNKIFHKINGKTILEIVFEKFQNLSNDVFLQTSNNITRGVELKAANPIIYHDSVENVGPLGGIYSAVQNAKNNRTFIVAGDLPFVDEKILAELMMFNTYDVVVPKWRNGFLEPLCAVYSKNILDVILEQINNNDFKISNLYNRVKLEDDIKIKYLDIEELIEQGKLRPDCFKNINTIDDLGII